jgi:hypothetical protein
MRLLQVIQIANGYIVIPETTTRHAETISKDTHVFETFENLATFLKNEFIPHEDQKD